MDILLIRNTKQGKQAAKKATPTTPSRRGKKVEAAKSESEEEAVEEPKAAGSGYCPRHGCGVMPCVLRHGWGAMSYRQLLVYYLSNAHSTPTPVLPPTPQHVSEVPPFVSSTPAYVAAEQPLLIPPANPVYQTEGNLEATALPTPQAAGSGYCPRHGCGVLPCVLRHGWGAMSYRQLLVYYLSNGCRKWLLSQTWLWSHALCSQTWLGGHVIPTITCVLFVKCQTST
ncbi:uncharacterized protein LOC136041422 isoform X2 [Artemia franciscana]|uniref:uncharacterized protein LOC136041422 isoform X2 n=1 Tax=Artemia franciscana TaxID=6661 RepID=UPI0032DBA208